METVLVRKKSLQNRVDVYTSRVLCWLFKFKFENLLLDAGRILEITAEWLFVLEHTFQYR